MTPFDIRRISDAAIRAHYARALRRRDYIAASVKDAFGADRLPIETRFIDEAVFNAYARRGPGAYVIELTKSVPLLVLLLFEKLLSDPNLFPWIDASGVTYEKYTAAFIVDPVDFEQREGWEVHLTAPRSYAANTLADIMVAFVQMHELGHILCGHVDATRELTGRLAMAELVELQRTSRGVREREQAWEADADAVAMTFVADHVASLSRDARESTLAAAVFGHAHTVEHTMSIVIASLWAMFSYLRGARYSLRKQGSHPHPLVRTYYTKDMLITAIQQKTAIDLAVLLDLIDRRLEEMLVALQTLGLSHNFLFDHRYVSDVERRVRRLTATRKKHRSICAPWAWFSWSVVG